MLPPRTGHQKPSMAVSPPGFLVGMYLAPDIAPFSPRAEFPRKARILGHEPPLETLAPGGPPVHSGTCPPTRAPNLPGPQSFTSTDAEASCGPSSTTRAKCQVPTMWYWSMVVPVTSSVWVTLAMPSGPGDADARSVP